MVLKEQNIDVIKMLPEYATAHCISQDCAMGAGVVLAFRKAFPGLKEACMTYRTSNPVRVGNNSIPMPYRHVDTLGCVYNMFTKPRFWFKAGKGIGYDDYLSNLEESLRCVRQMMINNGEDKLAMPKIGCGLDGCKWDEVKAIIEKVFISTDFEIVICIYEQDNK